MSKTIMMSVAAIGLLAMSPAFAHPALKLSAPAGGATVEAPQALNLTFSEKARLTAVRLITDGKDVSGVRVDRAAPSALSFNVPLPALAPAKYEVRWTALGDDGHAVNGTFAFTVSNAAN
jgi:methionine-rich copper-binding protein CopC